MKDTLYDTRKSSVRNSAFSGSYPARDVTFLLKDISDLIRESTTEDREEQIQSGTHYSEMLPVEYKPSEEYLRLFHSSLSDYAGRIAQAVAIVSEKIIAKHEENIVLVSLARAGTPAGILIKRYLELKHDVSLPHYSISIIRGKGIDRNAMDHILRHHEGATIQFVDGWTGKGTINSVLQQACKEIRDEQGIFINDEMAVIADPGHCTELYGTREDFLVPSACLNSTVSGLVSRTVHRKELIGENDFHGVKYYRELESEDVSNLFIDTITAHFHSMEEIEMSLVSNSKPADRTGIKDVETIINTFSVTDINFIKPGIGETTRVLLRRIPWKVLVKNENDPELKHVLLLAKEKGVPVEVFPLQAYRCCGIIRTVKERQ